MIQTRVYDEETGMWLNVTKNYTVYGDWTRQVKMVATIAGLGQPMDVAISPNGQFVYVCTGYQPFVSTYSASSSCSTTNECSTDKGSLTLFKREPYDGSLIFDYTEK